MGCAGARQECNEVPLRHAVVPINVQGLQHPA
eukprot:CAMPEP_0173209444 /NCGR_PEP_ID=MMETSP1141-20130122/23099_1 /TAXON_ID=483371 /ORGANISM="non described non described, Strain CCMP2298" /LENGTH=31 /DNA_ID= /DNA_START= /DNA_END= /DNA_ORIENTATION=